MVPASTGLFVDAGTLFGASRPWEQHSLRESEPPVRQKPPFPVLLVPTLLAVVQYLQRPGHLDAVLPPQALQTVRELVPFLVPPPCLQLSEGDWFLVLSVTFLRARSVRLEFQGPDLSPVLYTVWRLSRVAWPFVVWAHRVEHLQLRVS